MKDTIILLAQRRGVTDVAIRQWRCRGGVPHRYRLPLLADAKRQKKALAPRDFEWPTKKGKARVPHLGGVK